MYAETRRHSSLWHIVSGGVVWVSGFFVVFQGVRLPAPNVIISFLQSCIYWPRPVQHRTGRLECIHLCLVAVHGLEHRNIRKHKLETKDEYNIRGRRTRATSHICDVRYNKVQSDVTKITWVYIRSIVYFLQLTNTLRLASWAHGPKCKLAWFLDRGDHTRGHNQWSFA